MPEGPAPRVLNRLKVFVSSTSDLIEYRDATEKTLSSLSVDERRYESFPSSPRDPLSECLKQVAHCDALVLILGNRYGSLAESGRSFTHEEYREAEKRGIPVFAYRLTSESTEPEQQDFIAEVERNQFRCAQIEGPEHLADQVRVSLLQAFHDAFKECFPPPSDLGSYPPMSNVPDIELPRPPEEALALLQSLYRNGDDTSIQSLAAKCELRFLDVAPIMALVYSAEVNLAQHLLPDNVDQHRLKNAVEFWSRTDLDDGSADAVAARLYNKGNALDALGRYSEAIESHKQALAQKPRYAECWKNLGSLYDKVGDLNRAVDALERALEIEPTLVQGLFSLGTILIGKNLDPETGLKYLEKIRLDDMEPRERAVFLTWKAHGCLGTGRFEEGIVHAEKAIKAAPNELWSWMSGARLYSLARRADQKWLSRTAGFFERFVGEHPEFAISWSELGHALWLLSDWGKDRQITLQARNAFLRAAELGFYDDGLVLDRIAHAAEALGETSQAENYYRKAAENNPAVFRFCLTDFLMNHNRATEALALLQTTNLENEDDSRMLAKLASSLQRLGDFEAAAAAYERAIELDPNEGHHWFNLGGVFWNSGEPEQARKVWLEAIERFPDHEARDQLDESLRPRNKLSFEELFRLVKDQIRNDEEPYIDE